MKVKTKSYYTQKKRNKSHDKHNVTQTCGRDYSTKEGGNEEIKESTRIGETNEKNELCKIVDI